MKVLFRDKIIESFHFPFSEALSFSILLWTIWGLAEAFYWQRLLPFIDSTAVHPSRFLYIASFLIYLAIAAILAAFVYAMAKWVLFTLDRHESPRFRSITLCVILALFFLAIIPYAMQNIVWKSATPRALQYAILAFTIVLAVVLLTVLYHAAMNVGFRIRRSGTTMLSVLVLSALLSIVSFPLFSKSGEPGDSQVDLKSSIHKLMVSHYISDAPAN